MYFLETHTTKSLKVKSPLKQLVKACSLAFSAVSLLIVNPVLAQKISGKVVNAQGEPIGNALIELARTAKQVRSDESGYFSFDDLNEGIFELHASAKKHGHVNRHIEVRADDLTNNC